MRLLNSFLYTCLSFKVAPKPLNAEITGVTKDTISIRWDPPIDPGGQILAYRLTVKNVTDSSDEKCVQEIIFQCSQCVTQNTSHTGTCEINNRIIDELKTMTNQTMNLIISNVSPYVMYKVRIQAVSFIGDGHPSDLKTTTLQDIPQRPLNVTGSVINSNAITVTWNQPRPIPGVTTYYIKTYEVILNNYPVFVKFLNISGFNTQTVQVSELDAYWNYTFSVVTATDIGKSEQSEMSAVVTTKQDAPGEVTNFIVMRPANIFTTMQVSWQHPLLREKNGIIREYKLSHNISGTTTVETITADSETFQKLYYITPERYYKIELYAVNTIDQAGEKLRKIYFASSKTKSQLSDTGYSIGTVVGAAVGGVLCSVLVLMLIFWLFWRHRNNKTSKPSRTKHAREESKIGDQYEDIGMDSASSYQDFGEKDNPNVYDQIGRVHTVDKHYENMLP